ncbi:bifunctional diaminohydroxyphosphoribosylaminopyrimidine deaminase/5-amino-6-(5-phosphoribosylamino)uracil reductase RibD [Flavihumibacter sp. ZG627]|uniref:bifunctional diaminohydroxyphosphoribosylaminopyrimidine deaminase/5-amino-6-(5-phosphoribosylamino)uracil reductase RibD n=1 Tax=Flavihumibacter sp. ZG627 TaxID=1463156 RepID=UPI00057EA396|nr:bifunctional diaminohydroxyphosphoribosylaminopyrimidine deaminase/5-amino-6-(5-phosphoribosylamino)uracil reductase RibD [Flavihumibacter sp. ZG627]KIC89336.1 riboflavin biosynthesis protein RibD [Flavihumibacter sp. ZG627]
MHIHEKYMLRCLQLAELGSGNVAPNPMVGAVLVFKDRIIGEGFHRQYGREHAEVNCLASVKEENRYLIPESTMYVSLEPCAHYGKTPPCADLLIANNIPKVVIGIIDTFDKVSGKGVTRLKNAGVEVITGVLEEACYAINRRFFIFHRHQRPFIILKWAQSANNCIAGAGKLPMQISNGFSARRVHRWRSEESAIMVGTNTALIDDPSLTTRYWKGNNPVRILLDMQLKVPDSSAIFSADNWKPGDLPRTIIFNEKKEDTKDHLLYIRLVNNDHLIPQLNKHLYTLGIQSLLVEGGTLLIQSFLDAGIWDEARIITNQSLVIENGYPAPSLNGGKLKTSETYVTDFHTCYSS